MRHGVETLFEANVLNNMEKNQLIDLVLELQREKKLLQDERESIENLNKRVVELERSQFLYEQYGRRESIEITGIPDTIGQDQLEEEVIKIYAEANIECFGRRQLRKTDISACHRIGKKGVTIVRFVNRKLAFSGLVNSKNLKDSNLYPNRRIYINNSFCKEFAKYGFIIRKIKDRIAGYRVRNGVYQIKVTEDDNFVEISHSTDFTRLGLGMDVSEYL